MSTHGTQHQTRIRPPYTLKVAQTKDEIEACYDIRIEVFSVEQGFPLETEIDEYDSESIHFLLTTPTTSPPPESTSSITPSIEADSTDTPTTEKPIGTIRFVPSLCKLTRLALHKEYRKYGFGKVLVEEMEHYVRQQVASGELAGIAKDGAIKIKCHSQLPVKAFYAKLGYTEQGPEFDEEGELHQNMVHEIAV